MTPVAFSFAQSNGTGFVGNAYYRVSNYATSRYIYVTDNKDYYDKARDKEDFQAIQLWKDAGKTISDPSSVIYILQYSASSYNLQAQGTGVRELTGYTVNVKKQRNGTYEVSATDQGVTKYLSDNETSILDKGTLGTSGTGNYRRWIVDKIETNHATNYFGVKPTIEVGGKYYQPFYASFPFRTASAGMHVYYLSKVAGSEATLKEITGDVPAATPVIIECSSADPSANRLDILAPSSASLSGNLLSGVYFCNGNRKQESTDAYTKFNEATMRVFSVKDGKLVLTNDAPERLNTIKVTDYEAYVKVNAQCLYANTSYMKVQSGAPAVLEVNIDGSGINEILSERQGKQPEGVYSLTGAQLRSTNDVQGLPAGIYIVGGCKFVVR